MEFALVEDSQVVINRNHFGRHLFGGGEGRERLVEIVRLRVGEAQVQIVRGKGMSGFDDLLKFGDGLRVLALLVIRLAHIAPGLECGRARCPGLRRHGTCSTWLRRRPPLHYQKGKQGGRGNGA